jgi:hypothetical protein
MRTILQLAGLIVFHVVHLWAQNARIPVTRTRPAHDQWSFVASGYGSIVPNDQSYFTPMFSADHTWLHLEARYNYEDQETASLWAGYNLHLGETLTLDATPMFGVVFGNTTAVAPGYEISLTWKRLNLSSQGEYVANTNDRSRNFFYSWDELVYSPRDWFHTGLVLQHTRAYQSPVDLQPGASFGFAHQRWDFTTYILNVGLDTPTAVLGLTYSF